MKSIGFEIGIRLAYAFIGGVFGYVVGYSTAMNIVEKSFGIIFQ